MIKRIVLLLLTALAVYGVALSPFSITNTLERKGKLESAIVTKRQAEQSLNSAKTNLLNARNAFESERAFDIHYSDLYKIKQLFDSVSGVSFSGMAEVDPKNNYALGANINPDDYVDNTTPRPSAVKLTFVAEDIASGLRIVDKLQLPVVSITTSGPGTVEVIFLTGGES